MAGPARTLWRKASPRKATDESLLAACLPRHRPFAYPVCVVARKPRFRSGNLPRHVRIGTSVCVTARKPRFRSGNLPRHVRIGTSVCVAARKPRFRPGNPPRHVRIGTSVCVVARKPRFRSGNLLRHVRIGTSFCVAASGDDPSSSTAVRRTGHCQKKYLQQKDYRKDNHRKDNHRMRLKASTRISWTRNRCCDQFNGHKMRSDSILHILWPPFLRKLPPSLAPPNLSISPGIDRLWQAIDKQRPD